VKKSKYPNLCAEQARKSMTDAEVAKILGVSNKSYNYKRHTGRFKAEECAILCNLFNTQFEYLFAKDPETT
jgi:DNA-binding XRE family transcriptional regulator